MTNKKLYVLKTLLLCQRLLSQQDSAQLPHLDLLQKGTLADLNQECQALHHRGSSLVLLLHAVQSSQRTG
jgi:hypothetical protein